MKRRHAAEQRPGWAYGPRRRADDGAVCALPPLLDTRHPNGGMSDMTVLDYAMMVEDTRVNTLDH